MRLLIRQRAHVPIQRDRLLSQSTSARSERHVRHGEFDFKRRRILDLVQSRYLHSITFLRRDRCGPTYCRSPANIKRIVQDPFYLLYIFACSYDVVVVVLRDLRPNVQLFHDWLKSSSIPPVPPSIPNASCKYEEAHLPVVFLPYDISLVASLLSLLATFYD
jgi:hypothetical protein